MKKYIVITSIFEPTEAIEKFSKFEDWQLVVVGDKKTPEGWEYPNVVYLSPTDQAGLAEELSSSLPWNSYSRKNIGYYYAIKQGADLIADTDDDNIPYENWTDQYNFNSQYSTYTFDGFINMYSFYTDSFIWPRGFPLDKILTKPEIKITSKEQKVGIWQYLADEDPDVDAIYRLTNNTPVFFDKNDPIVLDKGTLSPFNSQNTIFTKEFFPLLYLPAYVTFRFTDILRGLIAQPLLWSKDASLAFGKATVIQKRNPHNYLKDFESEIPCYLYPEEVIVLTQAAIDPKKDLTTNIMAVYTKLIDHSLVGAEEKVSLQAWLKLFT